MMRLRKLSFSTEVVALFVPSRTGKFSNLIPIYIICPTNDHTTIRNDDDILSTL